MGVEGVEKGVGGGREVGGWMVEWEGGWEGGLNGWWEDRVGMSGGMGDGKEGVGEEDE